MIIVADNIQITNPVIAEAVNKMNPEPVCKMAVECERAGADMLDINSGPLYRDEVKMRFLIEAVQSVSDLPLLIDTANPVAMRAGLEVSKNITIINGFSLEPKKLDLILPMAREFDTGIIGFLLHPNSHVPSNADERFQVALEIFSAIQQKGIKKEKLIIDPVLAPVSWQDGLSQNMETLSVLSNLDDLLGFPVRTIGGISNLTTGPGPIRQKRLVEKTYIPMLANSGLDMALVNVFHQESVQTIKTCRSLLTRRIFTYEDVG